MAEIDLDEFEWQDFRKELRDTAQGLGLDYDELQRACLYLGLNTIGEIPDGRQADYVAFSDQVDAYLQSQGADFGSLIMSKRAILPQVAEQLLGSGAFEEAVVELLAHPAAAAGQEQRQRGFAALRNQWYDEARKAFETAVYEDKSDYRAHYGLAWVYSAVGDQYQAGRQFLMASHYGVDQNPGLAVDAALLSVAMLNATGGETEATAASQLLADTIMATYTPDLAITLIQQPAHTPGRDAAFDALAMAFRSDPSLVVKAELAGLDVTADAASKVAFELEEQLETLEGCARDLAKLYRLLEMTPKISRRLRRLDISGEPQTRLGQLAILRRHNQQQLLDLMDDISDQTRFLERGLPDSVSDKIWQPGYENITRGERKQLHRSKQIYLSNREAVEDSLVEIAKRVGTTLPLKVPRAFSNMFIG